MLHALSQAHSARQVLWLHAARDGEHHPFAAEVRRLMLPLTNGRSYVAYSRPDSRDKVGKGFDAVGRLSQMVFDEIGLPPEADVYLCGPNRFMADMKDTLLRLGAVARRIHVEIFNGSESMTPGVVNSASRAPHLPSGETNTGPLVSFARSGIAAHWRDSAYQNILELAEACDVPVRWSCRTGVCHNCESGLVSGAVNYRPAPLEKPADGNVLVCCSQPSGDIVVDL
jgi:ferredoxin